ncbi:MAG: ATP-dependent helicase [Anaerolineales bacterium]
MNHPLVDSLNPAQASAVTTTEGPVLVLAGPGSGKTRVLTHRLAYLQEALAVEPWRLMAVTFTNKAAREMRERIEKMGYPAEGLKLGTFHAICAQILRIHAEHTPYTNSFTIYDTAEQRTMIREILLELNYDPKHFHPIHVLAKISAAKNNLNDFKDMALTNTPLDLVVEKVFPMYKKALHKNNALDFDDLLLETVRLFQNTPDVLEKYQNQVQYIMVDEFQDTNIVQYTLVRLLSTKYQNLFVVGDPDQSIYAFRGADYRNLRRIQADFPDLQVIKLEENYRSHQLILDAALAVIRHDPDHIPRQLFSKRTRGPRIMLIEVGNGHIEAHMIADKIKQLRLEEGYGPRDFAIIYRTNAQSRLLERGLKDAGLPYVILSGLRFYERKEIKDLLSYLYVVHNPNDVARFRRIINTPRRGLGKKSVDTIIEWAESRGNGLSDALAALHAKETPSPLDGRGAAMLEHFVNQLFAWIALCADGEPLIVVYDRILADINYTWYLSQSSKTESEYENKLENIAELRHEIIENAAGTLTDYLEQVSLVSDADTDSPDDEVVRLMTLHSAKGLEFPVVFMPGLEDNLLPHARSHDRAIDLAEERRLMYVGITRAKERLILSYAHTRYNVKGNDKLVDPSRFLQDLPANLVDHQWAGEGINYSRPVNAPASFPRRNPREISVPPSLQNRRFETQKPRLRAGDIVHHSRYGAGIVQDVKVYDDVEEVSVLFEKDQQIRRLDGAYLKKAK